jgi:regulator of replication initiation timing
MAVKKKSQVTKNSVIANTLESSVANLKLALEKVDKAVSERTAESKKLMLEARRLKKRRTTQMAKKKRAVAADRKNHTVDSGKLVRTATAELNATDKILVKATATRQGVLAELSGLKESQKTLGAYVKSINAADKLLASKNKRTRRKAKPQVN